MFERVYLGPAVRDEYAKITEVVRRFLFSHYADHPELLPGAGADAGGDPAERPPPSG